MTAALRAVHPALRDCLAGPMVAYDLLLPRDAAHVGVPGLAATLILAVDQPLDVGWLHAPDRSTPRWCSLSGLHMRPALVRTHGIQRGIQLSVTAAGCRALFGAPIGAVAGQTVDLADLPGGLTAAEHDAIVSQRSWTKRLAALEHLLLARLTVQPLAGDLVAAWNLLAVGARVAHVAAETGWSRRHLGNRVRAEYGVAPKELARLARFDRARQMVLSGTSLAEASHSCGFSDQSHLSREWKGFAGRSPGASAEEFPNIHDLLAARDRDSRT